MGEPKTDVVDATHQVFVLAFDLADAEIGKLPEQVGAALTSPAVQEAIKKTLLDYAKSKSQTGTSVISGDDAKKLVEALGTGVKDAASKELIEKIKQTPEYKKLESGIEGFKKAAQSSTLGVWIDRNKNVLYIVGAALVVGTATVLYVTKTGGSLVNAAVDPLEGKQFEVLQVGKLKLKAGLWDFQPDARILGARVLGTMEWQKVSVELKFGVLAQGAEIQQAEGAAVVKAGALNVALTANAKPQTHVIDLGLRVGYQAGRFNLGLGAMYQDSALSGTASAQYKTKNAIFGLQANVGEQKGGGVQYGGLLTVTIPIH